MRPFFAWDRVVNGVSLEESARCVWAAALDSKGQGAVALRDHSELSGLGLMRQLLSDFIKKMKKKYPLDIKQATKKRRR